MNNYDKKNVSSNIIRMLFYSVLFVIYLFPSYWCLQKSGISGENYIFICFVCVGLAVYYFTGRFVMTRTDLMFLFMIAFIVLIKKSPYYCHLISLVLVDKLTDNRERLKNSIIKDDFFPVLAISGCIFYSFLYFGYENRYVILGIHEVNQSGFAILMLGIILKKKSQLLSAFVFVMGMFTLSKSYLLGLLIFLVFEQIKKKKINQTLVKLFTFRNLSIAMLAVLLGLSAFFTFLYETNRLSEYAMAGVSRFTTLFDYSNYFRFTINTDLLLIYSKYPKYLFTGLSANEFFELSWQIASQMQQLYRKIQPHNYFFSYFQIYGIFCFPIFLYVGKIMNKIVNKENLCVFLSVFSFAMFLGVGLSNYWLYLSVFALLTYAGENKECYFH